MLGERFRLLKSLGWLGWLGGIVAAVFALMTVFFGIYSINTGDDRMSHWVSLSALATVLISIGLTIAIERKRRT